MSRFMTGPRDNGPANPPPWPKLRLCVTGIIRMVASVWIAYHYEWIGKVDVKGPCVGLMIIGFLLPICVIGDGFDEARKRGEDDV